MAVTLVHASIDERGKINGGQAGDQTSKEVCTRTYYSKPWNVMLRYKDSSVAKKAVEIAVKLAKSNLVGYDQYQRNTLYKELKKCGWDVDKYIKSGIKTETDCSAFLYTCYCCLIPEMRSDSNPPTTSTMRAFYKKHGFIEYTESKYLSQESYLRVGDVLVKEGSHTVMAASNGDKATSATSSTTKTPTTILTKYYPKYTGKKTTIVDILNDMKIDSSLTNRKKIAKVNGIGDYTGTSSQNTKLCDLVKAGKLIKA